MRLSDLGTTLAARVPLVPVEGKSLGPIDASLVTAPQNTTRFGAASVTPVAGNVYRFTFTSAQLAPITTGQVTLAVGTGWSDSAGNAPTAGASVTAGIGAATVVLVTPGAGTVVNALGSLV